MEEVVPNEPESKLDFYGKHRWHVVVGSQIGIHWHELTGRATIALDQRIIVMLLIMVKLF